ncbi:MAG: hypothetical protein WBF42_02665 [Terracidiphilus sp.]
MMSLDNTIWLVYLLAEALLAGLLIYKRAWRLLPFFFAYCIWDLLSNIGSFANTRFLASSRFDYTSTYLIQTVIDSAFQFCILIELAWSVLKPVRSSLPRYTPLVLAFAALAAGAIIWPFTATTAVVQVTAQVQLIAHLQQTVSILRILFFLGLAAGSQLLSIGWRDREFQVATGLGIYSLVSLAVTMVQTHETAGQQYAHLNQFVIAGFICALLYWIFSFAQKEAVRREFTPQMQSLLLAVAGAARANRTALSDRSDSDARFRGDD